MFLRVFHSDTLGTSIPTGHSRRESQRIAHREKMPLLPLPDCQRTKPQNKSLAGDHFAAPTSDGLKQTRKDVRSCFKPSWGAGRLADLRRRPTERGSSAGKACYGPRRRPSSTFHRIFRFFVTFPIRRSSRRELQRAGNYPAV
jgi:hypothetical protein